ncbi:prepilin peptidase [Cedecea lapagei]|nr:A24 family peptidase [Cedecea lapagei]
MISTSIPLAWLLPAAALYFCFALRLSMIDFRTMLLPDRLTLPLLWLGLLFHSLVSPHHLCHAVYGAVAGYLCLWLVFQLFKYATGKAGLGYGDFKLLAAIGAWNYWQNLPLVLAIASLLGLVYTGALSLCKRRRSAEVPFGPWLAIAGWGNFAWQMLG